MLEVHDPTNQFEVHDPAMLAQARAVLDACSSPQVMQEAVLAAVTRNEEWLARANIITNKNLIPADRPADWDHPGGLRVGTT